MRLQTKNAIAILLFVVTITSGFVTIYFAPPGPLRTAVLIILFVTIIALIVLIGVSLLLKPESSNPQVPGINGVKAAAARYTIEPATREEIEWIARLEADTYSSEDAIPEYKLKEWYDSNPYGFFIIRMNEQKIGHIDILPLRSGVLEIFRDGKIREKDIPGSGLHTSAEREAIRNLYVESIIISPVQDNIRGMALLHLLSSFVSLVSQIANPGNVENVYAIAASESGENLMKQIGFDRIKAAQARIDGHDLFAAKFVDLAAHITEFCGGRLKEADKIKQLLTDVAEDSL
jgi:hypothetical protein